MTASLIGHLGQALFCCSFTWDRCHSSGSRFSSQSVLARHCHGPLHACVGLAVERPAPSRGVFQAAADMFGVIHGPRPVRTIPSWSLRVSDHAMPSDGSRRNSVPSVHMRCITTASFLATATTARRRPFRRIRRRPQLLIPEPATARIIIALAAA